MTARDFTTDDIVVGVQIPGVYDGTCCWLLKDGRIINRMTDYGLRREQATREWIARHGDNLRAEWGITTDQPRQQARHVHTGTPCACPDAPRGLRPNREAK